MKAPRGMVPKNNIDGRLRGKIQMEVGQHQFVRPDGGLLRAQFGPLHGQDVRARPVFARRK